MKRECCQHVWSGTKYVDYRKLSRDYYTFTAPFRVFECLECGLRELREERHAG